MRLILISVLFFLPTISCIAQSDTLQAKIILIGDAGQFTNGTHPVISAVKKTIEFDAKTTVVFLGDNVYKVGLPDQFSSGYAEKKRVLDTQINVAIGSPSKVYFIPGNHDWNNGSKGGWEAIIREQQYVDLFSDKNVDFEPKDGCPGPVLKRITDDVVLIMMDSQWWVQPAEKPGIESDCPFKTRADVLDELDRLLAANSNKLVIFACHHTFKSKGPHGGYFTAKQYFFPFTDNFPKLYIPIPFGFIYPITRLAFGTSEDLAHPAYADLIAEVSKVTKKYSNVIFTAGHEHTLQLIKDSAYYIVSGSGSKQSRVSKSKKAPFTSSLNGFATLEISKNKNVAATFYTVEGEKVTKSEAFPLMNFSTLLSPPKEDSAEVSYFFKDSAVATASTRYKNPTEFKKLFLGKNYRAEWSIPVPLKVFYIRKEKGGLKILSDEGGRQKKSLRLVDKKGKYWTLRSIDKDPEKIIPENLQGSLAGSILQDMVSASHPYSALAVPDLANAINVRAATPQYFFVPDDPNLGIYRKQYANTIAMLEERDPSYDATDTKTTFKIVNNLYEDNDNHVDQPTFLRARLLDMMIGDWDRHYDQWKWGILDTGKGKLYYPIPRDRDKAFFNSDGFLLSYLSKSTFRYLQGFKKDFPNIKWFNWEARDLDRFFLNDLDKNQWQQALTNFQSAMSNDLITQSVKKMPPEIYALKGQTLINKMESRRDKLMKEGIKYYNFISKTVNIVGSNKKELFKVTNTPKGLEVKVFKRTKKLDSAALMYDRVFDKSTKEIRLYGLSGNDYFDVDNSVNSKIKLRIIGGSGNDTFNIRGNIKNYLYDISADTSREFNYIINKNKSKIKFSKFPSVNEYNLTGFNYNEYHFPRPNIAYNVEDRLMFGVGFLARTHGFRKEPYSTEQKISTLYSFNKGAYQLKYNGSFIRVLGNNDLQVNGEMSNPTLDNFFGFGDTTVKSKPSEFYRVRYKYAQGELLLRKRFFDTIVNISFGPVFYHYWNNYTDNNKYILANPRNLGLDSASIYNPKSYVGAKIKMDVNFLNNPLFPTRGFIGNAEYSTLYGTNSNSKNISKFTIDMSVYGDVIRPSKLIAILRGGWGLIFSKNPEYFQTLNLGANNFLRGFRKDRFSGTARLYFGGELRYKLIQSTSYIFPGDFGLVTFDDVGRVYLRNEKSHRWHNSFGGGFYYAPFNLVIVSATVGFSKEDQLFNFSLGTKFNLTF